MWGALRSSSSQALKRASSRTLLQNRLLPSLLSTFGGPDLQTSQKRNFSTRHLEGVPVIDGEQILTTGEPSPALVQQVADACRDWGFFVLVNHGLDPQQTDQFFNTMKKFFALPLEDKLSCKRTEDNSRGFFNDEFTKRTLDLKEGFDFGNKYFRDLPDDDPLNRDMDGVNRWLPPDHPLATEFHSVMWQQYLTYEAASFRLTRVLSLGLGLTPDFFSPFFQKNSSFLRLNYYPQYEEPGPIDPANPPLGVNQHKDAGFLTLLFHDGVEGLQVDRDGEWYFVPNVRGSVVVNVGDMCQIWANDRYVAAQHRVVSNTASKRFSAPFFFNPDYTAPVYPIASDARYTPCVWGHFRARRFAGDYADEGVDEIQISDFRI